MKKLYNDGRDTLRSCGINYKNDTDVMLNSSSDKKHSGKGTIIAQR